MFLEDTEKVVSLLGICFEFLPVGLVVCFSFLNLSALYLNHIYINSLFGILLHVCCHLQQQQELVMLQMKVVRAESSLLLLQIGSSEIMHLVRYLGQRKLPQGGWREPLHLRHKNTLLEYVKQYSFQQNSSEKELLFV